MTSNTTTLKQNQTKQVRIFRKYRQTVTNILWHMYYIPTETISLTWSIVNNITSHVKCGGGEGILNPMLIQYRLESYAHSSSCPFPSEGNRALRSLSPCFSIFRTTTGFCPDFEPKFTSFSLYRSLYHHHPI